MYLVPLIMLIIAQNTIEYILLRGIWALIAKSYKMTLYKNWIKYYLNYPVQCFKNINEIIFPKYKIVFSSLIIKGKTTKSPCL